MHDAVHVARALPAARPRRLGQTAGSIGVRRGERRAGDVVEVEVERLGVLRNPIFSNDGSQVASRTRRGAHKPVEPQNYRTTPARPTRPQPSAVLASRSLLAI